MTIDSSGDAGSTGLTRRTALAATAWAVPVVTIATAAPAFATSGDGAPSLAGNLASSRVDDDGNWEFTLVLTNSGDGPTGSGETAYWSIIYSHPGGPADIVSYQGSFDRAGGKFYLQSPLLPGTSISLVVTFLPVTDGYFAGTLGTATFTDETSGVISDPVSLPSSSPSTVPTNPFDLSGDASTYQWVLAGTAENRYFLWAPQGYDPSHATPSALFVWLVGTGGYSTYDIYNFHPEDSSDYIFISPLGPYDSSFTYYGDGQWAHDAENQHRTPAGYRIQGGGASSGGPSWNAYNNGSQDSYVQGVVADARTRFNIDPAQVILGGYSAGGDFTYRQAYNSPALFRQVLVANTTPFRDTGYSQTQALAKVGAGRFKVRHLVSESDGTYPIATVQSELGVLVSHGFDVTEIDRPGDHYDGPTGTDSDHDGSIDVPTEATGGTDWEIRNTLILPFFSGTTPPPPPPAYVVPVDATPHASLTALATTLSGWHTDQKWGIGQAVNANNSEWAGPLSTYGAVVPPVLSVDIQELRQGMNFGTITLQNLIDRAHAGTVLQLVWHPYNPHTLPADVHPMNPYDGSHPWPDNGSDGPWNYGPNDTRWRDIAVLLDDQSAEGSRLWGWWTTLVNDVLLPLQAANVAVVMRPFHEANGTFFFWGAPTATPGGTWIANYKALFQLMVTKTWTLGAHNVLWAHTVIPQIGNWIADPVAIAPASATYDLIGLDAYDQMTYNWAGAKLESTSYAPLAALGKPMVLSEVGPASFRENGMPDTINGHAAVWDPVCVSNGIDGLAVKPLYGIFWFDDGPGDDATAFQEGGPAGDKQIGSLTNGPAWLAASASGFYSDHA